MTSPLTWHNKRKAAGMHHAAETILDMVMDEGVITVTDAMLKGSQLKIQTPASIYTHLKWLRDKQYLQVTNHETDGRIKHCSVTRKGMKYLGYL